MKLNTYAAATQGAPLLRTVLDYNPDGGNDVVIRVSHCGICHSDLHMIDNDWGMSAYPLVPGHEVVGEVVETGSSIRHLKPGDRVGVGWQRSACLACPDCLRGNENLCDQTQGVITHGYGGFADHLVVDGNFAFKLPDGVASESAGPLLCGGITVYDALRSAGMRGGQKIGVIGIGGLGHIALKFARALGNEVVAFTTSADKAEEAGRLGAHHAVVATADGFATDPGAGYDILLSTVPASIDVARYLDLLAGDGTLSFVGVPAEPLTVPLFPLLMKRRRIMASPIGGRSMILDMLHDADRFGVEPVVEMFPMDAVNDALDKVRKNTIRYRAVVVA